MSNWLTVRLTASRSSARSAPISYTPPVNPPPPSTSAVRERRVRRRRGFPRVPVTFLEGFWSFTTSPIQTRVSRSRMRTAPLGRLPCSTFRAARPPPHAARAERTRACPGRPGGPEELPDRPDAAGGQPLGRLRDEPEHGRAGVRLEGRRAARARLQRQAVRLGGSPGPVRHRGGARHRAAGPPRARRGPHLARGP